MKKIALLLIVLCFIGCESSSSILDNNILTGNFKEITPVEDRVKVAMAAQSLTYLKNDDGIPFSFTIKVLPNNMLELSCNACDEEQPQIVSYKIIDIDTFEIGGFIQETLSQTMTFERVESE